MSADTMNNKYSVDERNIALQIRSKQYKAKCLLQRAEGLILEIMVLQERIGNKYDARKTDDTLQGLCSELIFKAVKGK